MSGVFFTSPLCKSPTSGSAWTHVDAYFPELQVFANVLLSRYATQAGQQFSAFLRQSAEAYIVTPLTPMTSVGTVSFPSRRDNTVYLRTDRLTFWLQVDNGGQGSASASAVGIIYDVTPTVDFDLRTLEQELHLAVFDQDGTVVGSHRSLRVEGGPAFDEDEVRDRVLAQAYVISDRPEGSLTITDYDPYGMAAGADLRVDPSTGKVEELATGMPGSA
jgi:hypothetical protein